MQQLRLSSGTLRKTALGGLFARVQQRLRLPGIGVILDVLPCPGEIRI